MHKNDFSSGRFDEVIDRKNSDSMKYGAGVPPEKSENLIPLWVADMDFKAPDPVIEALTQRVQHGIFGYGAVDQKYMDAVCGWFGTHFNADIDPRWIVRTPGVVFALATAIRAFTSKGDAVLINRPVYYPFSKLIDGLERKLVNSPLRFDGTRYEIDFADLEEKIVQNDVKLYLLCSPHNPVGRLWTRDELIKLADICLKHDVIVVSDEIHCDFIWSEHPHTMYTTLGEKYLSRCVVCTAPSKTFNLASMMISNIFVPNKELRQKFQHQVDAAGISQLGVLGLVATQTAYEKGDEWYENMLKYVWENIAYVKKYVKDNMPGVNVIDGEGTYLLWLDFRGTGIDADELDRRIIYDAKLWLDSGKIFGKTGTGFQRINVAAPRKTIEECMKRIEGILK